MSFHKLSDQELLAYGIRKKELPLEVEKYLQKYYPNWARTIFIFNAEYNDEYYNHSTSSAIVFDKNGNEIVPKSEFSVSARKEIPTAHAFGLTDQEQSEATEEIVYYKDSLPDLYVKE